MGPSLVSMPTQPPGLRSEEKDEVRQLNEVRNKTRQDKPTLQPAI